MKTRKLPSGSRKKGGNTEKTLTAKARGASGPNSSGAPLSQWALFYEYRRPGVKRWATGLIGDWELEYLLAKHAEFSRDSRYRRVSLGILSPLRNSNREFTPVVAR